MVPTKLAENYPASSKLPGFYQRIPEVLPTFLPQWHSACGKAVTETGWTHQYTGETGIERSSTSLVSGGTSFERRGLEFDPGKGSKWIYDGPQSITLSAYVVMGNPRRFPWLCLHLFVLTKSNKLYGHGEPELHT